MGKKFVGLDGLKHFWTKVKTWVAGQITAEVTAKIAEIVANAPEDLDTLKEIADWIKTHANDASAMNTQINTNKNDIAALQTSVAGKAAASHTHDDRYYTESEVDKKLAGKSDTGHTHTKSQITDFPTSLPANKITPNYTRKTLAEVTSDTTKYIKLADCAWNQTGTLQVYLTGANIVDTLVIDFGGGSGDSPILCGHYSGNDNRVLSVIAQKGLAWDSNYSIYVKISQLTTCNVNVALLKGDCTINITESTTAPTNISEWPVSYGLFGTLTGNSSFATNADKVDNYHANQLWRSDGATWNPNANVSLNAAANGDEWSFDISRNGHTGCYWHVWDSTHSTLLKVDADSGKVSAPYGFVGNLSGKADTAGTADKAGTAGTATTAAKLGRNGDTGIPMTFNWSGQGGQPSWLWGGNDGSNMYVYNPSNFSVNTANTAYKIRIGNSNPSDGDIWIQ